MTKKWNRLKATFDLPNKEEKTMTKLERAIFQIAVEYMKGSTSSRSEAELTIQDANPRNVVIPGMHWIVETDAFAREHHEEIAKLIVEEFGETIPSDLLLQNNQAWFAWGTILPRIQKKVLDAIEEDFVDDVVDEEE
jgi:hypothetical protein